MGIFLLLLGNDKTDAANNFFYAHRHFYAFKTHSYTNSFYTFTCTVIHSHTYALIYSQMHTYMTQFSSKYPSAPIFSKSNGPHGGLAINSTRLVDLNFFHDSRWDRTSCRTELGFEHEMFDSRMPSCVG